MRRVLFWLAVIAGCLLLGMRLFVPGIVERAQNKLVAPPPYKASEAALALHQTLLVADMHVDTLLWGRDLLRHSDRGHVDLPRMLDGNLSLVAFTVVTAVPRNLNIDRNDDSSDVLTYLAVAQGWPASALLSRKGRALYQAKLLNQFAASSNGQLVLLKSKADLQNFLQARSEGKRVVGAWLGSEGAHAIEGNLDNLDELFAAGYRMMAPTHFTDTAVGGAAAGVSKGGLTPLGRDWVRRMEAKGMLIDLAHASSATLKDVTSLATKPVVVSHTGVKGTCNNNRNLSDDELRAVAATGGVIGIGYWDTATCGRDAKAIAAAIRYATNLVGVEHVGLGSDFDGAVTEPFDVTGLPQITEALQQQNFSEHDIRLIMGENVVRVLSQVLPD